MADRNEKCLSELLKYTGNNVCADCGARSKLFYYKKDNYGVRFKKHATHAP